MRAGLLKQRIDIEANTDTPDALGYMDNSWSAAHSSIPATITPLRGNEGARGGEIGAEVSHKVTIRHIAGITPKYRIKYGSRYFDIQSVINVREQGVMLEIMCVERV